jgi:primase-polymerase (primpol)-like protein
MSTSEQIQSQFQCGLLKANSDNPAGGTYGLPALEELATYKQWVAWDYEINEQGKKPRKVPASPRTCTRASVTDRDHFCTHEEARCYQRDAGMAGVGFVFCETDPYVGVDLDNCRDPETGALEDWAQEIIRQLHSYTEISPSGTGVKIWVRAKIPGEGRRKGKVEMYDRDRFFTFTGQHLADTPTTIEDRQTQVSELHRSLFGAPKPKATLKCRISTTGIVTSRMSVASEISDDEVLRKALAAKNGDKFRVLWEGRWEGYGYRSQSEADMALCGMLAYWTDGDPAQMDRLFRRSGLMRDKWDDGTQTYGDRTIQKVL